MAAILGLALVSANALANGTPAHMAIRHQVPAFAYGIAFRLYVPRDISLNGPDVNIVLPVDAPKGTRRDHRHSTAAICSNDGGRIEAAESGVERCARLPPTL
eukprot:3935347-Prymnesium_polylepis.2